MTFNKDYFWQADYGGSGGNSIFHYYSATDNMATAAKAAVDQEYFKAAFNTHGITARKGDIIFWVYSAVASSAATLAILVVSGDWVSTNASVVMT